MDGDILQKINSFTDDVLLREHKAGALKLPRQLGPD
jgi:hypothetical protein